MQANSTPRRESSGCSLITPRSVAISVLASTPRDRVRTLPLKGLSLSQLPDCWPGLSRQGTGRCRIPLEVIAQLGVRPGDAVAVEISGVSTSLFLCNVGGPHPGARPTSLASATLLPEAHMDGCIELPAEHHWRSQHGEIYEASSTPGARRGGVVSGNSRLGVGRVWALRGRCVVAGVVRLRCEGWMEDPPAAERVHIAAALQRHVRRPSPLFCTGDDDDRELA